jgi:hypothetical protein
METTILASGAAAMLLVTGGPRLRSRLGDDLVVALDRWADDGPDTEQLLCLTDLLQARARADTAFGDELRRHVLATGEGLAALQELAARLGRSGYESGSHWCLTRATELERLATPEAGAVPGVPLARRRTEAVEVTWTRGGT